MDCLPSLLAAALLAILPVDAQAQGLECLVESRSGSVRAEASARQAMNAAQRDWEEVVRRETGYAYRWVFALQTERQLERDATTEHWRASVGAHPCRLRPKSMASGCAQATSPSAARAQGCPVFYP
jgi:hypothetical protein